MCVREGSAESAYGTSFLPAVHLPITSMACCHRKSCNICSKDACCYPRGISWNVSDKCFFITILFKNTGVLISVYVVQYWGNIALSWRTRYRHGTGGIALGALIDRRARDTFTNHNCDNTLWLNLQREHAPPRHQSRNPVRSTCLINYPLRIIAKFVSLRN